MKMRKMLSKNIVLIALGIAILGRLIVSYPLDSKLLGGSDFMGHVPVIWFISNFLSVDWDQFWYAGYPLIKYVSPLPHLMGSFFAFFTEPVIAYKIVINFFFLIAPIAFYLLVKDFNMSAAQKFIAILIFSFFPSSIHYFMENSFPTLISITFFILTLKFFKDYAESGSSKNLGFSGIFMALSILVQQLTAFFNGIIIFAWLLVRYKKIVLKPFVFGLLISGFWFFPFLLEYSGDPMLKESFGLGPLINSVTRDIGVMQLAGIFVLSFVLLGYLPKLLKDREFLSFFLMLVLIILILLVSSYMRIISIVSVPLAILFAKTASEKFGRLFACLIIFALAFSFFTFHDFFYLKSYDPWEVPEVKSRVIYYPQGYEHCESYKCEKSSYSAYLPLLKEQETMTGVRIQYLRVGDMKEKRFVYFDRILNPLNLSDEELYGLLEDGFVNTVVVNKFFPEYASYFSKSSFFRKTNETEHFLVFEINPQSSYLELNGNPIEYDFERKLNKISLEFDCRLGGLTIKESYDNYWSAYLDGKKVGLSSNKYGFMKIDIGKAGKCNLEMKHQQKQEYNIFYLISFASIIMLFSSNFFGNSRIKKRVK